MKLKTICALVLALAGCRTMKDIEVNGKVDVMNRYLLRGFEFSQGPVVQPTITATSGNATVGVLGNYDTVTDTFNEVDLFGEYSRTVGRVTLTAGYNNIHFFGIDGLPRTQEAYVKAGLPDASLAPYVTVVHDFDHGKGTYAELGVSHQPQGSPAIFSASVAYNNHYYREGSGFSNAVVGASFPIPVGRATFTPTFGVSLPLDGDFETVAYAGFRFEMPFTKKK